MAVTAAPSTCRALVPWTPPAAVAGHDVVVTPHPLTLAGRTHTVGAPVLPGDTLASVLARHGVDLAVPGWHVQVGGLAVPVALCRRTRVRPGQLIEAHRVPGKSAVRLLALVALAYFTMGGGFFGAAGLGGTLTANGFAAYAINVGAFMVGSAIINKLLPPAGAGGYGSREANATYSLQGARNNARQYGPLGLLLGQVRVAPDFAAQPFTWYEGDSQYQYVQLHAGLNVATVDELRIGDTAIGSFSGVQISRTGFPSGNTTMLAWEAVDTVAGGALDASTAPGAWVERTSSADTVRLQVDVVGDLHYVNSGGNYQAFSVSVDIEYKLLPSGSWQPFQGGTSTVVLTNSSSKPLRRTLSCDVAAGQYTVRMRKATANETRNQAANTLEWQALKSYQASMGTPLAHQVVGIRILASGQVNGVLDQVSWLATSKPCELWTGSAWVTTTTSNPGALALQFIRGEVDSTTGRLLWGYGKPDEQIDIEGLKAFMLHCAANSYRFDYWFSAQTTRREVLDALAAAGLGSVSRHTGKLGIVFMSASQPIEAVVNMANVKRGTMRVDYATRATAEELEVASPERTADWRAATLRVLAPGVTMPRETARLTPVGVTTQAGRLTAARFAMAQNLYGRKSVAWEMDLEHLTVRRWSVVALSHDLTQWGHGGRLHQFTDTAGTISIELDAEVPAGSTPYVGLRLPGEQAYRVFGVVPFSGSAHTLTLSGAWPAGVTKPGSSAGNPAMDTLWMYDFKATPGQRLRVTDIQPTPDLSGARITAVPEPDDFWTFMASGDYTVPAGAAPAQPVVLSNLRITQDRLAVSYDRATDLTITFDAEGPYQGAQVWAAQGDEPLQRVGETRTTRFSGWRVLAQGEVHVEVRPFDAFGRPAAALSGTHTVELDAVLIAQGNLLPVAELVAGLSRTAAGGLMVGRWAHNAVAAAPVGPTSVLLMDTGPDGQPAVVWRSTSGTGGDAQGGWERAPDDAIDSTKAYRFAAFVRVSGGSSGQLYFGCRNVLTLAGSVDANPYFFSVNRSALVAGRWYLAVGYVNAVAHPGTVSLSGLWDGETGDRIVTGTDFKWATDTLGCGWRTYQFYTTAAGAVTDWAWPMVHHVDGTEPSVAALLAMSARGRLAWMTASSQVFGVSAGGTASPSSITLTALSQGVPGAPSFAVVAGSATLSGSGTTRTLAYADMATDSVTVRMTWAGIEDQVTIVKVREGAPGADAAPTVRVQLSQPSIVLAADVLGAVGSFSGASTTVTVTVNESDDTGAWTISRTNGSGISSSLAGATLSITGASVDSGYVDITVAKFGYLSQTVRVPVTKVRSQLAANLVQGFAAETIDTRVGPSGSARAGLVVKNDGTIFANNQNVSDFTAASWYEPNGSGVGAAYSVKCVAYPGSVPPLGAAMGTWIAASTEPEWYVSIGSVGEVAATCTLYIALTADTTKVLATGYLQLDAEKV